MRVTVTALGRTWLDLSILEDDPADVSGNDDMAAMSGNGDTGASSTVELFTGTPPFGFRPTMDPWPPSWE